MFIFSKNDCNSILERNCQTAQFKPVIKRGTNVNSHTRKVVYMAIAFEVAKNGGNHALNRPRAPERFAAIRTRSH